MAGRILGGRYTVQDKIGTGGMAVVYRGLDEVLGRTVAIKTMLPQYAADPSFAARFKQEAQAAAALSSPYIVSVYDWGKDGDTYYIAMEYLRGTDLKSGIRKHGALDGKKVAQIGSQIAQALSVAHRHEIIHRDVKPQNIMVQPDGNIKVMDFGIARAKNSHLTQDNSVLGTAHYVSPEQTQGKELGPTTDIYSLGIVMYEAATGQVPFDGDDAISVALKQVNEQPKPPSAINPNVDPSLESIILKCMQKDPANRFQTADELKTVLRDYLAGRLQAVNNATALLPVQTASLAGATKTQTVIRPSVKPAAVTRPSMSGRIDTDYSQQMENENSRKRTIAIVLGILAFLAIGVGAFMLLGNNGSNTVPNLLNLEKAVAIQTIEETNGYFELGSVTEEYSDSVGSGLVIDQNPKAGRPAEKGTKIDLIVSKGAKPKEEVEVPDLKGMTPSEAQAALTKLKLVGSNGDSVYDDSVESGKVAKQSPEAGATAKEGDTITYHLSKGKESVEVPEVEGLSEAEAISALEKAKLKADVQYGPSNDYAKDLVYYHEPGGTVDSGSTITIFVSTGVKQIEVPYVIGQGQDNAIALLKEYGFEATVNTVANNDYAAGVVIDQSPSGTISSTAGNKVTLTVSSGPEQTDTPDNTSGNNETSDASNNNANSGTAGNNANTTAGTQS